jgi:hypothetical protein
MNFDRENPNQTNAPQTPDFSVPTQTPYFGETPVRSEQTYGQSQAEPQMNQQQINPFEPPEYRQISENQEEAPQNQNEEAFDEREIANWQAQEMVIGEKGKRWYVGFFVTVAILSGLAIWQQAWTFLALILVSAATILLTRNQKQANSIAYSLSTRGVYIGNDFYPYNDFKSFGILEENGFYSIVLKPNKRFSVSTAIYFPREIGEKITDIIGARLPMEQIERDLIDNIIRKIKL